MALAAAASAQGPNPVYPDDSPVAAETLSRVAEFIAARNDSEAVRELQKLLDEQPDRVVPAEGQPDLFISVRARVHALLLSNRRLLDLYRAAEEARARQQLSAGDHEGVERSRLLTPAGFEAALRTAQAHMEAGRFEAARLTLEQLDRHPDRQSPAGAADSAALAANLARYLDREDVRGLASRWASEAGQPAPAIAPVEAPPVLRRPVTGFFAPAGPLNAEGIPPRALWVAPLGPAPIPSDLIQPHEVQRDFAEHLWILPTVVGDTVYINDGVFITARDRFTLQPRWSTRPVSEPTSDDPWIVRRATINARTIEDTATVTVHGRTLVATMGAANDGDREGDRGTFGLDADTGRLLWGVDVSRIDPQLDGASVRGPAVIDGDTVVLAARKPSQGRRIVSFYLVGLNLHSGALRWVRPIASAGAIPWGARGDRRMAPAPIIHEGVVYCTDHLGVIAAVEAATGRPVWVRRAPVPAGVGGFTDYAGPHAWALPIIDGPSVVVLAPDRSEVLRLDRATGEIRGRRRVSDLGSPAYLLRVGDMLAAVGNDAVNFVPLANLESGPVRRTRPAPNPGLRARVVVAGDRLLLPRIDGIAVIDPARPNEDASLITPDHTGNVLPLQSQLLIADGEHIYSYLTWTVAEALLQERIARDPNDPEPAITYADLAYRAGRHEKIAEAADLALGAIDRAPATDTARAARQRLFTVLLQMAEQTQASWQPRPPAPQTLPTRPGPPGTPRPRRPVVQPELPPLDLAHLRAVVERLGRAAQTPDQRVSYLMVLGRLRDAEGAFALAAEAYQQVLADPLLAGANWKGAGSSVRAELEATRRIRQLVLERGPRPYAAFDAEARRAMDALGAAGAAADAEALARRYPASSVAPILWARAADAHDAAGRRYAAIAALREGLTAAEAAASSGVLTDAAIIGELGGRLANRLLEADQVFAAAQVVARLRSRRPGLALSDHGTPVDADSLARELAQRLATLQRFPRIGIDIRPDAQPLPGWQILPPRSRDTANRACEHIVLISPSEGKVALWGIPAAGAEPGAHLQMLWARPYQGVAPVLLRLDPDSVYLLWEKTDARDGAVIERIGTVDGQTRWRTDPFRGLFPADEAFERRRAAMFLDTPIDGQVRFLDVLVTIDEQVIAVVERSGRAAAFDPETGRLLWNKATPVTQVHDIDAGAGAVVIGGAAPREGDRGAARYRASVLVLDARSGQTMHALDQHPEDASVRWTRIAVPGEGAAAAVIVGLMSQIDAYDLATARVNWSIAGGPAFSSLDAWVFGDRLFILDPNRLLYLARVSTGHVGEQPIETYEHLVGDSAIHATPIGEGRRSTAFTTSRGMLVVDDRGTLVAMDAIAGGEADDDLLLPAAIGEGYFVTVETIPRETPSGQLLYPMYILDTQSGMIRATRRLAGLDVQPRHVALLDGRILVTAGPNTVVYAAPEGDSGR